MLKALVKLCSIIYYTNLQNLRLTKLIFRSLLRVLLVFIFCRIILGAVLVLSKKRPGDREQVRSFECGFDSARKGLIPFRLQFYLIANIFLIFDVELILLFPILRKLGFITLWFPLGLFSVLLLFLSLGLFHEWNQKMLDWAK